MFRDWRRPALWFVIGLGFAFVVYLLYERGWLVLDEPSQSPGGDAAMMFVSAYLLEYALAFDILLVTFYLLGIYRVRRAQQTRVLGWALLAALGIRFVILFGAAAFVRACGWAFNMFGAFYLCVGLLTLREPKDSSEESGVLRTLRRSKRIMLGETGDRFWGKREGRLALTALGVCVFELTLVEVMFALDSIAVVAVTTTTFVIITSNVLATIALRGWIPQLDEVHLLQCPRRALAALLVLVAIKLVMHDHRVPPVIVLAVLVALVAALVTECSLTTRRYLRESRPR